MNEPGQFVHIKVADGIRSTSKKTNSALHQLIKKQNEFTMIYRAEGQGTKLLSKNTGDQVDILGPLGNGFPVDEAEVEKQPY